MNISWCTDSSLSPLIVELSQVLESALLDNPLKAALVPVTCAPFPYDTFPFQSISLWNSILCIQPALQRWPSVTPCGGCGWASAGQLYSRTSSPWLWLCVLKTRPRDTQYLYCMNSNLLKYIHWIPCDALGPILRHLTVSFEDLGPHLL